MKQKIKKILKIGSAIAVIFIVAFISYTVVLHNTAKASKKIVNKLIPAITKNWDIYTYQSYLDPKKTETLEWDKVDQEFETYAQKLGKMLKFSGTKGYADLIFKGGLHFQTTHTGEIWCKKGKAKVFLVLRKDKKNWWIETLRFDTENL